MLIIWLTLFVRHNLAFYTLPLETIIVYSQDTYFLSQSMRKDEPIGEMVSTADTEIPITILNNSSTQIHSESISLESFMEHNRSSEIPPQLLTNSSLWTEPLDNYYNFQYIGSINVRGDDNRTLRYRVIFDTGSSWIWLPRRHCNGCPSSSGIDCAFVTCRDLNRTLNVTYSIGGVQGVLTDGWLGFDDLIFQQSEFLLVHEARGMEGAIYQGIVGLDNGHKLIQWPVGFFLSSGASEIHFGGVNTNLIIETMQFVDVQQHWLMEIAAFDFLVTQSDTTNSHLNLKTGEVKPMSAVIDSGSSLLMLPSSQLAKLYSTLERTGIECSQLLHTAIKCACPTHNLALFPTIEVIFTNHVRVTLEPHHYIHTRTDSHVCHVLISPIPSPDEALIILGNPFMRKYYTLFDRENRRVGLAKSVVPGGGGLLRFTVLVSSSSLTAVIIILLLNRLFFKGPQDQRMNYRLV